MSEETGTEFRTDEEAFLSKKPPEEILRQLVETGGEGNTSKLVEQLLEAFGQGFPVANLEPLLRDHRTSLVRDAGYILFELGKMGAELIGVSVELLSHPLDELREAAIENLLANSDRCEPEVAWAVVSRYPNETQRIKQRIVNYLALVPLRLLRDAVSSRSDAAGSSHEAGFRLHLPPALGEPILNALTSEDQIVRAYAISAIIRLQRLVHSSLRSAARSDDPVVSSRAQQWLPK